MIAEVHVGPASTRTVQGANVQDIATTQFRRDVTVRPERHGVWAVIAKTGGHGAGVIGRIHPISR